MSNMADPIVELNSGFVRGSIVKHEEGFNFYSFKGIPYAEPPIGELRFEDPVPIKRWSAVLECKSYAKKCFQYDFFAKSTNHNEDCLYLNVFTRSINEINANNPVIVVIHGGAFMFGSGDDFLYGPDYLIRKNLVMVTFNYRLGVLGFLNLEDEIAPGNQGLKDQLMVLKWVQDNIRSFGGDPNNVTVWGSSAGAAAAQYITQSPLTKGLVHKVIMQGCTVYNPWLCSQGKSSAIKLCSLLGRRLIDSEEIKKFLKTVDSKELEEAQERLQAADNSIPFGPGKDDKSSNPYMPIHKHVAADRGVHLPCLTGYTNRAGLLLVSDKSKEEFFKICDMNFDGIFQYNTREIVDRYNLTTKQVRRLYYQNDVISEKNLENYVDFASDFYFIEGIHKFLRVQAEMSSAATYVYKFSYDQPNAISKMLMDSGLSGASHLDELPYLFKCRAFDELGVEHYKKGTRPYKMMEQMTEMWSNFVRYGKPTIEKSELTPAHWLPNNNGTVLRYLNLDDVDINMQSTINVDQKLLSAKDTKD